MNGPRAGAILVGLVSLPGAVGGASEVVEKDRAVQEAPQLCADRPDDVAVFADPGLEAAVRDAVGIGPQDRLACSLVSGITELRAEGVGIRDLQGIHNLSRLAELFLDGNPITDLSPLSELADLRTLRLYDGAVTSLDPLSDLKGLTTLRIGKNFISDISPLEGLTQLRDLGITDNDVSDLSPLEDLAELRVLRVYNNPISDIGVMRGLTELTELHIHDLPDLSDIQPLIENPGLGAGDRVILSRSGVSCADASALQATGVAVSEPCFMGLWLGSWVVLAGVVGAGSLLGVVWRRRRLKRRLPQ